MAAADSVHHPTAAHSRVKFYDLWGSWGNARAATVEGFEVESFHVEDRATRPTGVLDFVEQHDAGREPMCTVEVAHRFINRVVVVAADVKGGFRVQESLMKLLPSLMRVFEGGGGPELVAVGKDTIQSRQIERSIVADQDVDRRVAEGAKIVVCYRFLWPPAGAFDAVFVVDRVRAP